MVQMVTTVGTTTAGKPSLARRQLGRRLRELREAAGMSQEDVVRARFDSTSKLSRIENASGTGVVRVSDVWALCRIYKVTDEPVVDLLADLAAGAEAPEWWESYGEIVVPDWFGLYAGLEASASRISAFDPDLMHGLLQTEEYARAILSAEPRVDAGVIESRIHFRLARQPTILGRRNLTVVLGAGAMCLEVGGRDVLAAQVEHLRKLHDEGAAEIRVIPWTVGAYPVRGAYAIMDFPDPSDPATAYTEVSGAARYVERQEQVRAFRENYEILMRKSVSLKEYR